MATMNGAWNIESFPILWQAIIVISRLAYSHYGTSVYLFGVGEPNKALGNFPPRDLQEIMF